MCVTARVLADTECVHVTVRVLADTKCVCV